MISRIESRGDGKVKNILHENKKGLLFSKAVACAENQDINNLPDFDEAVEGDDEANGLCGRCVIF